jgi:hypothetical protein
MGLFSSKVLCDLCGEKVPAKDAIKDPESGLTLCNARCRAEWEAGRAARAAAGPRRATGGTPASYREEALRSLREAHDQVSQVIGFAEKKINIMQWPDTHERLLAFESNLTDSLPYLYALDRPDLAESLLHFDLQGLYALSPQMAKYMRGLDAQVWATLSPMESHVKSVIFALEKM